MPPLQLCLNATFQQGQRKLALLLNSLAMPFIPSVVARNGHHLTITSQPARTNRTPTIYAPSSYDKDKSSVRCLSSSCHLRACRKPYGRRTHHLGARRKPCGRRKTRTRMQPQMPWPPPRQRAPPTSVVAQILTPPRVVPLPVFSSGSSQPVSCHQMSRHRLPYCQSSCPHPSCRWPSIRWSTYHWPYVTQTDNRLVVTNVLWSFTGSMAVWGQQGGTEEHGLVVRCAQQMLFFSCFQKSRSRQNSHLSTRLQSLRSPISALSPLWCTVTGNVLRTTSSTICCSKHTDLCLDICHVTLKIYLHSLCPCVCVSSLTVDLRLLYLGGAGHAPSTPHY